MTLLLTMMIILVFVFIAGSPASRLTTVTASRWRGRAISFVSGVASSRREPRALTATDADVDIGFSRLCLVPAPPGAEERTSLHGRDCGLNHLD
jgi:hypothetical protein